MWTYLVASSRGPGIITNQTNSRIVYNRFLRSRQICFLARQPIMKRIIDRIKKLFGRKKQVFIIEIEDLKEYISSENLFCDSCHKPITDIEEISRVAIRNKQMHVICMRCKGG